MRVYRRVLVVALACLVSFCLSSLASAQSSDQAIAERVLGPQWKQLSRRAGMIFAGTVLAAPTQTVPVQTVAGGPVGPGAAAAIELSFRVDEAIAGVDPGQVLTIHEWAGAWAMQFQRPMSKGQHVLIFLYPASRLGLTSPVGGSLGQVALDSTGKNVSKNAERPAEGVGLRIASSRRSSAAINSGSGTVSVVQLERAIRSAREE
jgi:hypothetical protein